MWKDSRHDRQAPDDHVCGTRQVDRERALVMNEECQSGNG